MKTLYVRFENMRRERNEKRFTKYPPEEAIRNLRRYLRGDVMVLCPERDGDKKGKQAMNFLDLARARYSVRDFRDVPVAEQDLRRILEAGRIAPTACNKQPQRIKVIAGEAELAMVDACTPCRFNAPLVLLVCYDSAACWTRSFDGAPSGEVDAAIVATHLLLAAQNQGLGGVWVMHFDPAKTAEVFQLPENIIPVAMLPIGCPAKNAKPAAQHHQRVELADILL